MSLVSRVSGALFVGMFSLSSIADVTKIPTKDGWSGFVGATSGVNQYSSNLFVGNGSKDFGNQAIASLNEGPESESKAFLAPFFDFRYTLAKQKGQIFLGNLVQDAVRFDFTQQLGYRQELDKMGLISGAFVFSGMPAEVWEDAYVVGTSREATDRKSSGLRLAWEKIAGSQFGGNYTFRSIDVDNERNGESAVSQNIITATEQQQLQRSGKQHRIEVKYGIPISQSSLFTPSMQYLIRDFDGKAQSGETTSLQLNYTHFAQPYTLILNSFYGIRKNDVENPIYDKRTDAEEYGVAATLFYSKVFNMKEWSLMLSTAYVKSENEVSFHDMEAVSATVGLLYNL